jgi:hypothetical protein
MKKLRAYKLLKLRRNNTLGPLFINRRQVIEPGTWLKAKCYPTKGYAVRPGWHCTHAPEAPHLSKKGRVWCEVTIKDYTIVDRPVCQGGRWYLANYMKLEKIL